MGLLTTADLRLWNTCSKILPPLPPLLPVKAPACCCCRGRIAAASAITAACMPAEQHSLVVQRISGRCRARDEGAAASSKAVSASLSKQNVFYSNMICSFDLQCAWYE